LIEQGNGALPGDQANSLFLIYGVPLIGGEVARTVPGVERRESDAAPEFQPLNIG
jgi:hypothetical protein